MHNCIYRVCTTHQEYITLHWNYITLHWNLSEFELFWFKCGKQSQKLSFFSPCLVNNLGCVCRWNKIGAIVIWYARESRLFQVLKFPEPVVIFHLVPMLPFELASTISSSCLKLTQIYLFKVLTVHVIVLHLSVAVNICLISLGQENNIFFLVIAFLSLLSCNYY